MHRYYVELNLTMPPTPVRRAYLYVYAYGPEQVKDMLKEYHIFAIDQTD